MKSNVIIKSLLVARGLTQKDLAAMTGKVTQSAISNAVSRGKAMKIDTFLEMVHALDAEVVVRIKGDDKSEWVID